MFLSIFLLVLSINEKSSKHKIGQGFLHILLILFFRDALPEPPGIGEPIGGSVTTAELTNRSIK